MPILHIPGALFETDTAKRSLVGCQTDELFSIVASVNFSMFLRRLVPHIVFTGGGNIQTRQ